MQQHRTVFKAFYTHDKNLMIWLLSDFPYPIFLYNISHFLFLTVFRFRYAGLRRRKFSYIGTTVSQEPAASIFKA